MTTADAHDTAAQVAEDASMDRTVRPSATDLLAEALNADCLAVWAEKEKRSQTVMTFHFVDAHHRREAPAILAASPRLAASLDLGLAWQDAVDALPEGWLFGIRSRNPDDDVYYEVYTPGAFIAYAQSIDGWKGEGYDHQDDHESVGHDTPAGALRALAARIREVTP